MKRRARATAAAKLNLHLEVGHRMPDGYHELESLFQALSFSDELDISLREDGRIELLTDFGFPAEENLVFRALRAFREASSFPWGFNVTVAKRIPMGGGLGGGSSDAAAALKAANALSEGLVTEEGLRAIACRLGSDVPFFLGRAASIARGRGELLRPIGPRDDLECLIVDPGFRVSTKDAFSWLDAAASDAPSAWRTDGDLEAMYRKDPADWDFRNSFFPVIAGRHPELYKARDALMDAGASFAAMSGSGSTVFGIFPQGRDTGKARDYLLGHGFASKRAFLLAQEADIILEWL